MGWHPEDIEAAVRADGVAPTAPARRGGLSETVQREAPAKSHSAAPARQARIRDHLIKAVAGGQVKKAWAARCGSG